MSRYSFSDSPVVCLTYIVMTVICTFSMSRSRYTVTSYAATFRVVTPWPSIPRNGWGIPKKKCDREI